MSATDYPIEIEQGSTFEMDLTFEDEEGPLDVSDYEFVSQVRRSAGSSDKIAEMTITPSAEDTSQIKVSLTPAQTALVPVRPSLNAEQDVTLYRWELKVTYPDNKVERLLEGVVTVKPGVVI